LPALKFMSLSTSFLPIIPLEKLKVWVLAPYLVTNDANIDYYYDFSQSIDEYTKTFAALNIEWQWQPVTMSDYAAVIETIVAGRKRAGLYRQR
jgi:D-alanine-D-alanine ligase